MRITRLGLGLLFAAALLLPPAGCNRREPIRRYTVAKPPPIESPRQDASTEPAPKQPAGEPTDRMLAAIVPHDAQGWFFKLTGPIDEVAEKSEVFETFLKSVHFSDEGKPQWTLPEGWTEQPGSDIRYATLLIPAGEKPLELTVTALPRPPGDDEQYALVNINRWRGQMKLPPIALAALPAESQKIELAGATATMVDLVGTASSSMGRPPFFPGSR